MTDPRDEFYQPWVREPAGPAAAPVKRRHEPGGPDSGLARDEAAPLGVDLSPYALDDRPPPPPVAARVKPVARAAGEQAARLWSATRSGALNFADWTIRLGARADVPARIIALEIPQRSSIAAHRAGIMLSAAGRGIAAVGGRAGRATAQRLAAIASSAGAGIRDSASRGVAAGSERLAALRPAATPPPPPLPSGLDRLLESETAVAANRTADAATLPLFNAVPLATAAAAPGNAPVPHAAPPVSVADARPAREPGPLRASTGAYGHASGLGGDASGLGSGLGALPRWVPWGATALLGLALAFWLGGQTGGGTMDRAAMHALVKDVILANPEIVPQALEKHQANQVAAAIDSVRPVLEKPFSGAWAGNPKGDVTVTVFTDYGCVFCRASVADIDRLVRADKGVKLVYRELPIIAPQSKDAALAALAAARQGKYDAFHHAMFAAPGLDRAAIDAASTRAGVILDERSDAGVDTRLFEREIDNNLALAQQLGVNATPTWIVGSKMLQGAVGYDELRRAVVAARAAN